MHKWPCGQLKQELLIVGQALFNSLYFLLFFISFLLPLSHASCRLFLKYLSFIIIRLVKLTECRARAIQRLKYALTSTFNCVSGNLWCLLKSPSHGCQSLTCGQSYLLLFSGSCLTVLRIRRQDLIDCHLFGKCALASILLSTLSENVA